MQQSIVPKSDVGRGLRKLAWASGADPGDDWWRAVTWFSDRASWYT